MMDQKLWRQKKTFRMRSVRRDHIWNEIVHSRLIGITAISVNKIYFCFQLPQA